MAEYRRRNFYEREGACLCKAHGPQLTMVASYVNRRSPAVTRRLTKVLDKHAKRIASEVAVAAASVIKADDKLVRRILSQLKLEEVSVDVVEEITQDMIDAFTRAGIMGVGQVGFSTTTEMTKHLDKAAREYAGTHGADLVTDLTDTTTEQLRNVITKGVEEGSSPKELAKDVSLSMAFSEARAAMIARTELAFAHVQGNVQGWREAGVVEMKESILGDLHGKADICDDCAEAGQIPLEDEFIEGYAFPPYHPNCVCDVLPVVKEEDNE